MPPLRSPRTPAASFNCFSPGRFVTSLIALLIELMIDLTPLNTDRNRLVIRLTVDLNAP